MAFNIRALVLLAIVLCLQDVSANPNGYKNNKKESSELFSLVNTMTTYVTSFEKCKVAAIGVVDHFREIHSVTLEYVILTSHVTSRSLKCIVSNKDGIMKCISGVIQEHRYSYDLLGDSLKALLTSLGKALKGLVGCPFN